MRDDGRLAGLDQRTRAALDELRTIILARYPTATFEESRGIDEPENIHLNAVVDTDDLDEVLDLVNERLFELQVEERIPLHVIPLDTPERILADLRARPPRRGVRLITGLVRAPE